MKRLSWLKIDRPVLYLDQYILSELAIQRFEFFIGLLETIGGRFIAVYKGTPHHNAMMRGHCIRQHIGTIGMCSLVILWSWLSLRICFHQKTAKVRNELIDRIYF